MCEHFVGISCNVCVSLAAAGLYVRLRVSGRAGSCASVMCLQYTHDAYNSKKLLSYYKNALGEFTPSYGTFPISSLM